MSRARWWMRRRWWPRTFAEYIRRDRARQLAAIDAACARLLSKNRYRGGVR